MTSPSGTSWRNPDKIVSCPSTVPHATPDGSLVVLDGTTMNAVKLPAGASPTTMLFGLIYNGSHPTLDNQPVDVVTSGIYPGIAGGSITAGDLLTSNGTDGTVKTQVAGTGVNVGIIGQATADAASGERVPILIARQILQGG